MVADSTEDTESRGIGFGSLIIGVVGILLTLSFKRGK